MKRTRTKKAVPSVQERRLSLCLLGILALIAAVVFGLQYRYDPGQWHEQRQGEDKGQAAISAQDTFEGLKPISETERYDATTLSDKINGKADLYLSAGFKQLESRRFGLSSDTGRWMERYVYHMAGYRSAFSVFSQQRRTDVEPLELGRHAYAAGNGIFLVRGAYYLEIIASEVSDLMRAGTIEMAQAFIAGHPEATEQLTELTLFPQKNLVPNSIALNAAGAFGLDRLDWIFTGRYAANGHEATAFISRRTSAAEAIELASAFISYWRDYGGEAVALPTDMANYRAVTILDSYELVWSHNAYLLGVHEATDMAFGLQLAERLRQALKEGRHGP